MLHGLTVNHKAMLVFTFYCYALKRLVYSYIHLTFIWHNRVTTKYLNMRVDGVSSLVTSRSTVVRCLEIVCRRQSTINLLTYEWPKVT
jgi:hypothetical protein